MAKLIIKINIKYQNAVPKEGGLFSCPVSILDTFGKRREV